MLLSVKPAQRVWLWAELSVSACERVRVGEGKVPDAPNNPGAVSELGKRSVASHGKPRIRTRTQETDGSCQEKWNEIFFSDFWAMRWQHGQMVQGTPRIQNHQSTTSGSSKTGLQTLPRHSARYAWLPSNELRCLDALSEPRATGHSRCLQTTEGTGLRGPVHWRRKSCVSNWFELYRVAGHKVRVTETPTHKGGNGRKKQLLPGQQRYGSPSRERHYRQR